MLDIRTLGNFSVSVGDKVISDTRIRKHRVWRAFKYLITNRHKAITIETLIEILWADNPPDNPQKSLYTIISRLRKLLNVEGIKREYIIYKNDTYQLNLNENFRLDVLEFENLVKEALSKDRGEDKIPLLEKAIDIYAGDYLPILASELWINSVNSYYRSMYMRSVLELIDIYSLDGYHDDVIRICHKAISINPFDETLRERLIYTLYIDGNILEAKQQYKSFVKLMKKELNAQPSYEFRVVCENLWNIDNEYIDIDTVKRTLEGATDKKSAYFCSLNTFNQIYQLETRASERIKFPIFLVLLTVFNKDRDLLVSDSKSIKEAMHILRHCLKDTLRKGDIISQYSKSQFLLMLSARLPKDTEAAMSRVKQLFNTRNKDSFCEIDINLSQVGD